LYSVENVSLFTEGAGRGQSVYQVTRSLTGEPKNEIYL